MSIEVFFRVTASDEDVAQFETLEEAMEAHREGETITVVAYRYGEGSPFWSAKEVA